MMQAVGPMAAPFKPVGEQRAVEFDDVVAGFAPRYANYRKTSIYAGSNEIQRNIIAKATLGL
jgi:alkylation response protein AidB-like acyl-CoA dehydrogenase